MGVSWVSASSTLLWVGSITTWAISALAATGPPSFEFLSCSPESEYLETLNGGVDPAFCAEWNPDFAFRGYRCCPRKVLGHRAPVNRCSPNRRKGSYCGEMTADQRHYIEAAASGKLGNLLILITQEIGRKGSQAFCSVNNGFLAWGRAIVPTDQNRIMLRAPHRCTNFGTDEMVGMLEWLGHQVTLQYSSPAEQGVSLVVGDISAPRGGCLAGKGGRPGHRSHTSGQDADIGFLQVKKGQSSPINFDRHFDPHVIWWLIKKVFQNPYACVQVIFLDRTLIRKLAVAAKGDPDWFSYRAFIKHVRGHRNHFHVRMGTRPGLPGCLMDESVDLSDESEEEETEFFFPEKPNSTSD